MKIPQDIIDRIVQETNIVELVSESVPLKKAGANYKGLCPFHGEKTPSFNVSPQKQIFHCFGCGEGGGAIAFVMKKQALDFRAAVELLARRLQITIPKDTPDDPREDHKKRLLKTNQYARWFFSDQLLKSEKAQQYLKRRGFSESVIKTFELGYAPDSYTALRDFLRDKKIPESLPEELGLIKKSPRNPGDFYDFYRDRLIFPIHANTGAVIGFGGRTLKTEGELAKYVNSAESPVYHKSSELYGFYENKAAILAQSEVVIVEGYADVLACVQLGVKNVVAPLGTSLTSGQVGRLKRYQVGVVLMFDGDAAGQKAAFKAVELCLAEGVHPRVVVLPEGVDPGDFLAKDPNLLPDFVKNAPFALDWILVTAFKKAASSPTAQAQAYQEFQKWLGKLPQTISAEPYRVKAGQYFGISPEMPNKRIEKAPRSAMSPQPRADRLSLEEILVLQMWRKPADFSAETVRDVWENLENADLRELVSHLNFFAKKDETFASVQSINAQTPALQKIQARLMAYEEFYNGVVSTDCLNRFWQAQKQRQLKALTVQIAEAELNNNAESKMQLLAKKQSLMRK